MPNTITLAEALPLRASIKKSLSDLKSERSNAATVIYEKGDSYEQPARDFYQVSQEIRQVSRDLRKLEHKIAKANLENEIAWGDEQLAISEAIILAQELRTEASEMSGYARRKKVAPYTDSYSLHISKTSMQEKTLYEPEKAREQYLQLTRQANKLSSMIDAINHAITIEFSADQYMSY